MKTLTRIFGKTQRLSGPSEFQNTFRGPFKLRSQSAVIYARPNSLSQARLGITIAKRNIRSAVIRNAIRRIIRESFRLQQTQLAGLDIIIVVYKDLAVLTRSELRCFVDKQWQRLSGEWQRKSR